MLTVSADPVVVESQLAAGVLACPCSGVLSPWGHARERTVIGQDRFVRVRPRRGRCRACRATHVLLPAGMLLRRGYVVEVVGRVLELAALAVATRRIARTVGVARSTVRGWLARFSGRAELLRGHFTAWLLWLAPSTSQIAATGWSVSDAVAAITAAGAVARGDLAAGSVWAFASAATGGRLLANTSPPFPAPWTR
jgi:transposase-like protein